MPLLTTFAFHLVEAGRTTATWTQTLQLAGNDSGIMTWRREEKANWESERWTFGPGGVPLSEIAEGESRQASTSTSAKKNLAKSYRFRIDVAYDSRGATVRLAQTGQKTVVQHVPAPRGVSRGLPTPTRYRRAAKSGRAFRFAKYDAFRGKWDVIDAAYLGLQHGRPAFRERNPNAPATWVYTFDKTFGIASIALGGGVRVDRVSMGMIKR